MNRLRKRLWQEAEAFDADDSGFKEFQRYPVADQITKRSDNKNWTLDGYIEAAKCLAL